MMEFAADGLRREYRRLATGLLRFIRLPGNERMSFGSPISWGAASCESDMASLLV
jgi:hypothetical protein